MKFGRCQLWRQPLLVWLILLWSTYHATPSWSFKTVKTCKVVFKDGKETAIVHGVPNRTFRITCEMIATGSRKRKRKCIPPQIRFYYNNRTIEDGDPNMRIIRGEWSTTLAIKQFNESNIGTYRCEADSRRKRKYFTRKKNFDVRYSDCQPKFGAIHQNRPITHYSTASLACMEYPRLPKECRTYSVQFFKEGQHLNVSNRKFFIRGKRLFIYYFDHSDVGNYSCEYKNKYNTVYKNFTLKMLPMFATTKTLLSDMLPLHGINESRIYFLPDMVFQQVNRGYAEYDIKKVNATFYIGKNVTGFVARWFYQKLSDRRPYKYGREIPRNLLGKHVFSLDKKYRCPFGIDNKYCHRSELTIRDATREDNGRYTVEIFPKADPKDTLTFYWTFEMVSVHSSHDVRLEFVSNASVCLGQTHRFTCSLQPRDNVRALIMRLGTDHNLRVHDMGRGHKTLVKYPSEDNSSGNLHLSKHSSNAFYKRTVEYKLKNISFADAGDYMCAGCRINYCEEAEFSVMTLSVIDCFEDSMKRSHKLISYSPYVIALTAASLVAIIGMSCCALHLKLKRKAKNRSLMKCVIISRPNINYRSANGDHKRHRSDSTNSSCGRDSAISEGSASPLIPPKVHIQNRVIPIRRTLPRRNYPSRTAGQSVYILGSNSESDRHAGIYSDSYRMSKSSQIVFEFPVDPAWEFDRHHLIFRELLGSGAFGTVWRGEAQNLPGHVGASIVAVKMLNAGFDDQDLTDFVKEMEIMKLMEPHPHLIRLLGTCTQNGPPMVLTEYAPHGNLKEFLRKLRNPNMFIAVDNPVLPHRNISIRDLLTFSKQVAQGMEYLSSRSIVHRDLAARNILVGEEFCMKIADFGMTRSVVNYYRKTTDGRLPVKWMAPESLYLKTFTTKSDVWAYGILLWEIFSMGGTPYPSVPVEGLFRFLQQGNRNDRPELADEEIYGLMMRCWVENPAQRPWFSDLVFELTHMVEAMPPKVETDYCEMIDQNALRPSTSTAGRTDSAIATQSVSSDWNYSPSSDYCFSDYPSV